MEHLTWEEVEEFGEPLFHLHEGDKFVSVVCDAQWEQFIEIVGRVSHIGVGSITVEFMRGPKPDRCVWAPETRVIPIPVSQVH